MRIETERLAIRPFGRLGDVPGWRVRGGELPTDAGFGVFLRETGELIGTVAAGRHGELPETQIACRLVREARGFGYATEAVRAATDWALASHDIPYIIGTVDPGDAPARRVLQKCGYRLMDRCALAGDVWDERQDFLCYRKYREGIADVKRNLQDGEVLAVLAPSVYDPTPERLREKALAYLSDPDVRALACACAEGIAGVIVARDQGGGAWEILNIAVRKDLRGRGVGRALVATAVGRYRPETLWAETDDDAVEFYRRAGFQVKSLGEMYPGIVRYHCALTPGSAG